jgi:hypothetical protein
LGIGDWGLGPIPNPQSPIPNPQSPIPIKIKSQINIFNFLIKIYLNNIKKEVIILIKKNNLIINESK